MREETRLYDIMRPSLTKLSLTVPRETSHAIIIVDHIRWIPVSVKSLTAPRINVTDDGDPRASPINKGLAYQHFSGGIFHYVR